MREVHVLGYEGGKRRKLGGEDEWGAKTQHLLCWFDQNDGGVVVHMTVFGVDYLQFSGSLLWGREVVLFFPPVE